MPPAEPRRSSRSSTRPVSYAPPKREPAPKPVPKGKAQPVARSATPLKRAPFGRLVRFLARGSPNQETYYKIGEPVDPDIDVGLAVAEGKDVLVNVYSGWNILDEPGEPTGEQRTILYLLPFFDDEQLEKTIVRCIGLNYKSHAEEVGMEIPTVPTVFLKPDRALGAAGDAIIVPKCVVDDNAADYEAEVAVIIDGWCRNVSEEKAMDYCLGIMAANDVSSRKAQFATSQWSYSKGFDTSCPIGPVLVHKDTIKDWSKVQIEGKLNGKVVQKSDLGDLIFSIPKIISFLSQGTTLRPGTVILTGTPAGIGWTSKPRRTLQDGDVFTVTVSHGVGSLINKVHFET